MSDNFNQKVAEESQEFENIEKAQATQTQQTQQPAQKPQETFSIKDEAGKMIETATSSLFGATDPAQIAKDQQGEAKKKSEDQKKIVNIKNFLNQMAQDEQRHRQLKQEEQEKKQAEEQEQQQEKQEEEMVKQKKDQSFEQQHIQAEQSKAERKLGVGG
jgi:hypothetical protein